MSHHCHATGCTRDVPPKLLMCYRHWCMVPRPLQNEIWRTYVVGQEITKTPTAEYVIAQKNAIEAVEKKEGKR